LKKAIGNYHRKAIKKIIWHQLGKLQKSTNQPGYFNFEMPSTVPALELRLIPGEQQTSISGDLLASQEGFDQKQIIASNIQQHNISGGEVVPSKSIKIPAQNYAHWWFKPNQEPNSAPRAEIAFPVYELLFLGNDRGPFTLVWGNHEADAPTNDLISILSPEQRAQPTNELVQLRAMQISGGESRLSAQAKLPWLKWLLWLLLVSAVITTGKMAINLFRDMNTAGQINQGS